MSRDSEVFLRRGKHICLAARSLKAVLTSGMVKREEPGLPSSPLFLLLPRGCGRLPIPPSPCPTCVRAPGSGLSPACFPTLVANTCPHHASSGSSLNCYACFLLPPRALCSPGQECLGFPVFAATNHFPTSLPCLSPRTLGGLSPELRPLELLGLHGTLSGLSTGKIKAP